jgi:hypothetical protein
MLTKRTMPRLERGGGRGPFVSTIAQSIDPHVFTSAITKALVCKVVVGDILGEVPEPPKEKEK